jgi:hypothetical protein
MSQSFLAPLFLVLASAARPAEHFDGQTWWHTVSMLANDRFEGRDTGSTGERQAQAYIVQQLERLGVEPAATTGYYQPVKLRSLEMQETESSLALVAAAADHEEVIPRMDCCRRRRPTSAGVEAGQLLSTLRRW